MKQDNIQKAQLRAAQSNHGDGTIDLTFGSVFLLAAICFMGVYKMAGVHTYFSTKVLPILILALFIGGGVLIDTLVKWFKKNVTLRRTGSMVLRKLAPLTAPGSGRDLDRDPGFNGDPIGGHIHLPGTAPGDLQRGCRQRAAAGLLGLLFGVMWFAAAKRVGLNHFYLMAAISFVVSAMLFITGASGIPAMMILFTAVGVALCISGLVLMRHFIRNTGLPGQTTPEN